MKRIHLKRGTLVVLASALLLAGSPAVSAQKPGELATAVVYANGVDFQPRVNYSQALLTLRGGDTEIHKVFKAGESLSLGLFDEEGYLLADGRYNWELELVPDQRTARELRVAASENGGEAPGAWQRLTGSFAISGGLMALPQGASEPGQEAEPAVRPGRRSAFSASQAPARMQDDGDDDASIGDRVGVEEAMRAGERSGSRAATSRFGASLQGGGRPNLERSDAAALAAGGSLEPASKTRQSLPAQGARAARQPRSDDGANGRDKKDQ